MAFSTLGFATLCVLGARSHRRWRSELQELALHLLEREAIRGCRRRRRFHLARELRDGPLQIGIVFREGQRRAVLRERLGELAAAIVDFRDAADRGQVFRRALENGGQLGQPRVELVQLDERAAERDAG